MIGRTISHFRIDAKLGQGGMGVVYRATDTALGRKVALKILPDTHGGEGGEGARRFFREARSAAAVTHPNLATVYEVGEADGHVFIAMELIVGVTLRERLAAGLTLAEVVTLATQVASGLARAHEAGIVHRDLKPENVMVTAEGDAKILDFGLAKAVGPSNVATASGVESQLTGPGQIMGTPPYMSPEQAQGQPEIDARSDVFSFGVMLYELLTGVRPFRGATLEVLNAVVHAEPAPVSALQPSVPPALAGVVARCLQKQPPDRFSSGGELFLALGRISQPAAEPKLATVSEFGVAFQSTDPPRPSPQDVVVGQGRPETPSSRRGRLWVAGAAAVLLVGVAGAGGSWFGARGGAQSTAGPGSAPPSPREALLAASETLKKGSYDPKTVAECQAAYDTYKKLLPVVKPTGWENNQVRFVPGNVRLFAPGCFALAGDCTKAWTVYQEAWLLDPLLSPGSRALDGNVLRSNFEDLTRSCKGR